MVGVKTELEEMYRNWLYFDNPYFLGSPLEFLVLAGFCLMKDVLLQF